MGPEFHQCPRADGPDDHCVVGCLRAQVQARGYELQGGSDEVVDGRVGVLRAAAVHSVQQHVGPCVHAHDQVEHVVLVRDEPLVRVGQEAEGYHGHAGGDDQQVLPEAALAGRAGRSLHHEVAEGPREEHRDDAEIS